MERCSSSSRRIFGRFADLHNWAALTTAAALTPLAACAVLWGTQVGAMKQLLKRWIFGLLGKDPEAVVVAFVTGDPELCRRMAEEVRSQVPDRRHFTVTPENWTQMRRELRRYRIGLALVMLGREPNALRRIAYRRAPRKILAFNSRLERHHLRFDLASFLFWRGVPLDRIYLRPWWWPWPRRERSVVPGRLPRFRRARLLRRKAARGRAFPLLALSALARRRGADLQSVARAGARIRRGTFRLRGGRGAGLRPAAAGIFARGSCWSISPATASRAGPRCCLPEVHEFRSPAMRLALERERAAFGFEALQVEYTQLAEYGGDVLVEHDVTFDLFAQIARRERSLSAWWDWFRWRRFERRATGAFPRVVVMSGEGRGDAGAASRTAR